MEILNQLAQFVLHLDQHLITFVKDYGAWTYLLLFLIIFCETGIIVTAILPGDSLLFAAGTIAANVGDAINIHFLFAILLAASIAGNALNYLIGSYVGPKVFKSKNSWLLNPKHVEKTHAFYEKYGGKTIIIARFIPIVRTFAPFIAGVGYMTYREFFFYSTIGAILWVGGLLYASFLFGSIPFIKENFSVVIISIILISVTPAIFEICKAKLFSR